MILLRVMLHDSDCQLPYEACPYTDQLHPLAPDEILHVHARSLMIERREDGVIVLHVNTYSQS